MNARYLLAIAALAASGVVAACSSGDPSQILRPGGDDDDTLPGGGNKPSQDNGSTQPGQQDGQPAPGGLPTNSKAGQAFYAKEVHPFLAQKCAGCHQAGGAGNPAFLVRDDAMKSYDMIYLNGFAIATSRIVMKGIHSNGAAPELTGPEKTKFAEWIALEVKDGGSKAQANVLEKFGECFDKAKFDAIGWQNLRVTRRQNGNNPQNLNENQDTCTGCRDNTPCSGCHTADDVTGYVNAIGNTLVPQDFTFQETKKLNPAFIRQYVSTTPTGDPVYNPGVMNKSINTVEKAPAYSHPMFKMSAAMEAANKAFVEDAITKFKAGTCGK
ncbi:MAG: hypothetical protein KF819_37765 [Labilithrix sp.]|nr:hypothetical protein [Labilithrix sp.]